MLVIMKREKSTDGSVEMIVEQMTNKGAVVKNNSDKYKVNEDWHPVSGEDFTLLRWGCRGTVPEVYKKRLKGYLNAAYQIKQTNNKPGFRYKLITHGVLNVVPVILSSPEGLESLKHTEYDDVLLRTTEHSRGSHFYRGNLETLTPAYEILCDSGVDVYLQPYIERSKEYRVNFVQGKCIQVLERVPTPHMNVEGPWNEANTVNVKWGDWPLHVVKTCLEAVEVSGLFCGSVDVIICKHTGTHYILEINTAPELTPYQAKCFARSFDYALNSECFDIEQTKDVLSYKDVIHRGLLA